MTTGIASGGLRPQPLNAPRLALGSAQFGLDYGVANRTGQVTRAALLEILSHAAQAGLDTLDTAIAYGDSEARLGEAGLARWQVVSKLPRLPADVGDDVPGWVRGQVQGALTRLRVPALAALLLHHPADLCGPHGVALTGALAALRDRALVRKTGVSIYDPAELDALWQHDAVQLVQVPFNIVDRRLQRSGWLDRLQARGIEVHVRSVFLQGLLLLPPGQRPARFERWQSLWARWDQWLQQHRLTPLQACLRYVLSLPGVDRVVVGVDSLVQLREILSACDGALPVLPDDLASDDLALINPSHWQLP